VAKKSLRTLSLIFKIHIMSKYIIFAFVLCTFIACKSKTPEAGNAAEAIPESNALTTISLSAEQIKTMEINIGGIEMREMASVVKANGVVSVLNQNKAMITSILGGTVQQINVHLGDMVQKGQTIATLANPSFINLQEEYLNTQAQRDAGSAEAIASVSNPQYAALQEQYNAVQPQINLAEKEVKRQRELNTGNAGSGKMLQQAEAELATLSAKSTTLQAQMSVFSKNANSSVQTRLSVLENKLKLLGINPLSISPNNIQATLPIKSPISGKVGDIKAKIGAYINENNAICEIIDLNNLHLDLNIYETDIAKFHDGQQLRFTLINNPSQTYMAEVHNMGAMLDPVTKTVEVHAHIEGTKTGLIEGMSVIAMVNTGKNKVMAIPNEAIVSNEGKDYIFVLQKADNKETVFTQIAVRKGNSEGNFTEITPLQPLAPDAKIALNKAFFILGKLTNVGEE
jgi:membrane fusion protein, heavy metal efflux system